MALSTRDKDLRALSRLISQAHLVLGTIPYKHPSLSRLREILTAAVALSKDLTERPPDAVTLGSIGGKKTAERGSEYFKRIAGMRKARKGGRPKKNLG